MRGHGVKVPINLDHSDRAADCLGYIVDMSRKGETLHAICQFIGEDAAELAARNYVSVGINPAYKDGQNNDYGDAIVHVALPPVSIVPDQSHFALAANIQQTPVLALAASPRPQAPTQTSMHTLSCHPSTLRGLNRLIPGFEQAPSDHKIACLCRHLDMIARLDEKYGLAPKRMHLWNFDPDQPRDGKGQWTSTGDASNDDKSKYTICFAAGTLVLMADGSAKAIELIQPGEQVLSVPENNPEGKPVACNVAEAYHNLPRRLWAVKVATANDPIPFEPMFTTAEHPFYVKDRGWTKVEELAVDNQLRTAEAGWTNVKLVEPTDRTEPVFNLRVESGQTYFVTPNRVTLAVLVHNFSEGPGDTIIVQPGDTPGSIVQALTGHASEWQRVFPNLQDPSRLSPGPHQIPHAIMQAYRNRNQPATQRTTQSTTQPTTKPTTQPKTHPAT